MSVPVNMEEYPGVVGMLGLKAFSNTVPPAASLSRCGVVSRGYPYRLMWSGPQAVDAEKDHVRLSGHLV